MTDDLFYTEVGSNARVPLSYFMLLSLLRSRVDRGEDAVSGEEDVNVYLARALGAAADARYLHWARQFICEYDSDVFERLRETEDIRLKYTTYKLNADHLLLSIGIFDRERGETGRGQSYYAFATAYSQQLARRRTGTVDVLAKLSADFPRYVSVLEVVRRDYFNFIETLSRRAMAAIEEDVRNKRFLALVDSLLDVYSTWLRTSSPAAIVEMRLLVDEARTLQPDFAFEIPEGTAS